MRKLAAAFVTLSTLAALACSPDAVPTGPETPSGTSPAPSGLDARFTHISVRTYIDSVDGGDISSDDLGPYAPNVDGVKSILTENGYNGIKYGDWQFDTVNSSVRAVGHTFDEADALKEGDPGYLVPANPPFWGRQVLKQKNLATACTLLNRSMLTMSAGQSFECPLHNTLFAADGTAYGLGAARSFTGFPETTDALVVCNTADSGGCNDWFIQPIDAEAIARLKREASKPNRPSSHEGTFRLKFRIHITRP